MTFFFRHPLSLKENFVWDISKFLLKRNSSGS
jgi:hypothetical protein